jgi:hypothetical protein
MLLPSPKTHRTSVINVTNNRPKCPFEYTLSVLVLKDVRRHEWLHDDFNKPLHLLTSRQKTHWNTRPHVRPCRSAERNQRSGVFIQGQLPKRRTKIQSGDPHFQTFFNIGLMLQSSDSLDEILESRNKGTVRPPGLPSRSEGLGTKNTGLEYRLEEGSMSLNPNSFAIIFSISSL